jgi:DNA-binding NarL/FixJ family response regulator
VIEGLPSAQPGAVVGPALVRSDSPVIAEGVLGMLPDAWRACARTVTAPGEPIVDPEATLILDGDADGAEAALVAAGGAAIVLLGTRPLSAALLERADAVLVRDELEAPALRLALAAARAGVRVRARALPLGQAPTEAAGPESLPEPARRVLALLAEGMRDAEIARELHISESAVRKLVQRTVQGVGARTRYQAVAMLARGLSSD